jgi:hypothetical protein
MLIIGAIRATQRHPMQRNTNAGKASIANNFDTTHFKNKTLSRLNIGHTRQIAFNHLIIPHPKFTSETTIEPRRLITQKNHTIPNIGNINQHWDL